MKNIIPVIAIAATMLAACQGGTEKKTQAKIDSTITTSSSEPGASVASCYQYTKNRDTITLSINRNENTISGTLGYSLYEKDKNAGTLAGIVKGDTIIADYTFQSEGTTSVRQVVLLQKGNQLNEGFGEVEEVNGKTKFKDISKLKFDSDLVLNKTDCK